MAIMMYMMMKMKLFLGIDDDDIIANDKETIDGAELHIAADTRLVKICWIILVIFSFVGSLSKQYTQSGDIYQFAQMGECQVILVIDGSFW